jgi:hypothetical protein
MKTRNIFARSTRSNNKLAVVAFVGFLVLFTVFNLTELKFIQKGQAESVDRQNVIDAVSPQVDPTPPMRCDAYTAPSIPAPLAGRTFYIDAQNGNDSAAGTSANPWRTLAKANAEAQPGTLFYLRGVFTNQWISPTQSGTTANKITYRREPGQTAILERTSGTEYGVRIPGHDIVIDNIELRNISDDAIIVYDGGHHNWFRNLNIHHVGAGVFFTSNANNNRIEDSIFNEIGSAQTNTGNDGDAIKLLNGADNNIIVRNQIGRSGHIGIDDTFQFESDAVNSHNIIALNTIKNPYAGGIGILGKSRYALVECNVVIDSGQENRPGVGTKNAIQISGRNGTYRYNLFVNARNASITIQGLPYSDSIEIAELNHIYHNTVVDGDAAALQFSVRLGGSVINNTIENNLFWNHAGVDGANGSFYDLEVNTYNANPDKQWTPTNNWGNIVRNNNFGTQTNTKYAIIIRPQPSPGNLYYDNLTDIYSTWTNNRRDNPLFTNPANGDYTLQPNSPVIDKGNIIPPLPIPPLPYNGAAPDLGAFESGGSGGCGTGGQVNWQNVQGTTPTGGTIQHTGTDFFGMAKSHFRARIF